jgi:hypothetical protein
VSAARCSGSSSSFDAIDERHGPAWPADLTPAAPMWSYRSDQPPVEPISETRAGDRMTPLIRFGEATMMQVPYALEQAVVPRLEEARARQGTLVAV